MARINAKKYVMRRQGGNPFSDSEMDKLVGKQIRCESEVVGYTLLMTAWTETKADKK